MRFEFCELGRYLGRGIKSKRFSREYIGHFGKDGLVGSIGHFGKDGLVGSIGHFWKDGLVGSTGHFGKDGLVGRREGLETEKNIEDKLGEWYGG